MFANRPENSRQARHARQEPNREDYNRLRDVLIEQLLHRDRPPVGQADERRMLKAVHNWPFKFRGEKDTTSLNVFLDRVETFARSEGMSDATLLSSIKHLLQEDALDWYARATSQRLLRSWDAFKREIKREFLPSGYSQILRLEASFRFQGSSESFAKYYRDISALFRFVEPPIPEKEKFFIVKKNMYADYAAIVTAARPLTLNDMVEICTSYDETRMLLSRQRRIPIPHSALLEPNFATPISNSRPTPMPQQQNQGFHRVHAVEMEGNVEGEWGSNQSASQICEASVEPDEDDWNYKIDVLLEQVNALKMNLERKNPRTNVAVQNNRQHHLRENLERSGSDSFQQDGRRQRDVPPLPNQHRLHNGLHHTQRSLQQFGQRQGSQGWDAQHSIAQPIRGSQSEARSLDPQQHNRVSRPEHQGDQQHTGVSHQRLVMICWNCDEEGHRFMDCPKPQAVLFCYRDIHYATALRAVQIR